MYLITAIITLITVENRKHTVKSVKQKLELTVATTLSCATLKAKIGIIEKIVVTIAITFTKSQVLMYLYITNFTN